MSVSVACIDYRKGKVFIAKRVNKGAMGGRWEFPGGKLEKGEDFAAAIKREIREEFNVDVSVGERIAEADFEHNGKKCKVYAFFVTFAGDGIAKPFVLTEHTEYKWCNIKDIPSLNFVDSDILLYKQIISKIDSGEL